MKFSKNSISWFLTLLFVLLVLAACGDGSDTASNQSNNASSENGKEDTEKVYHLRMNSVNAPSVEGSPQTIAEKGFAELVKERTNGRVEIEIFYSNQLAGQSESLDALSRGVFDLQVIAPSAWADKIPDGNWASISYGWENEEGILHLLRETEFGDLYAQALGEYGVKPLYYYFTGGAGYLSTSPISEPDDMKGLVVNTLGIKTGYYKAMGAGIASIPFADYYEGLMRGTVDVVAFPYYAMETMKLAEVVDYVTVPGDYQPAVTLIAISQQTWDELPEDLQEIVMEAALEIEKKTIPASKEFTARGLEYAKAEGLEIVELTDEAINEFLEIGKQSYLAEFAKINDRTKKMLEIIEENRQE